MKIELDVGDRLEVTLKDTDGEFVIDYGAELAGHLRVIAEFPDDQGRDGVIYDEDYLADVDEDGNMIPLDEDAESGDHPLSADLEYDRIRGDPVEGPIRVRFQQTLLSLTLNPPRGFKVVAETVKGIKSEGVTEISPGLVRIG